jgi:CHAT domain-containing protein
MMRTVMHSSIPSVCKRAACFLAGILSLAGGVSAQPISQERALERYEAQLQGLRDRKDWPDLELLSRDLLRRAQSTPREALRADDWLALALHAQGRDQEAEAVLRGMLELGERARGPNDPETAAALGDLSRLLSDEGRYKDAEPFARRLLSVREKTLGSEHALTAQAANDLGRILTELAQYEEAERLLQRAIVVRAKVLGTGNAATIVAMNSLAGMLNKAGRYPETVLVARRALTISEKTLGQSHAATLASLDILGIALWKEGHSTEAEPLLRRALSSAEKALGPTAPQVSTILNDLGLVMASEGRYSEAEAVLRRSMANRERAVGDAHVATVLSEHNLGKVLMSEGRYAEAEQLYRHVVAVREKSLGLDHPDTAFALETLADLFVTQGRLIEAEAILRRALAILEKSFTPDHPERAVALSNLAIDLALQERRSEAEALLRQALAICERALGMQHPCVAGYGGDLGVILGHEGRYGEAERFLRRAVAVREMALGGKHPSTGVSLLKLAALLQRAGRYHEAEPLFKRALAITEHALSAQHPTTARARSLLARNDMLLGNFSEAVAGYRLACPALSAPIQAQESDATQFIEGRTTSCWEALCLSLWEWSAQGGGSNPSDRPEALKAEAFYDEQRAVQSAAGDAIARSAAIAAATSSSLGEQAQEYEAALAESASIDQSFAEAARDGSVEAQASQEALTQAHQIAVSKIEALASTLRRGAPLYWDFRSPDPVDVAQLHNTSGAGVLLLRDSEALIVFLVPADDDKGLVFALSKERFAWARLGLTGAEIRTAVRALRSEIDPEGYRSRDQKHDLPAEDGAFDRLSAYKLYAALLGDSAVQAVIADKAVLLFVPGGSLTTLPPGVLVTAPPTGPARSEDPSVLRKTPWLLRSKAVALIPAVSSLRTLRQIRHGNPASTPDPLLVFADPDFIGTAAQNSKRGTKLHAVRGIRAYYRDGVPLADALQALPSLPGTRIEGEALERALQGRPGSLLVGREASKAQLIRRNDDGRLAAVRVLEFATHGLVAGDLSDIDQPALVLAADSKPADELLTASEAATLKLNASWVILSACNTASPDQPEALGLSGLARAFFYAGARSLLVSHWRVRDDVAPRLIPAMLLAERSSLDTSRAEALRRASLAVLDDPRLNAAAPSAWAAFTLLGEADRD